MPLYDCGESQSYYLLSHYLCDNNYYRNLGIDLLTHRQKKDLPRVTIILMF